MNTMFAWGIGGMEVVLILVVILVMFGAKKIPEFAKGLGQGIKEFKRASSEVNNELQRAMEEQPAPPKKQPEAAPAPAPAPAQNQPNPPSVKVS